MNENLKTFPTGRSIWAYQRWKENFEKELRKKLLTKIGEDLIKEILGEG